MHNPKQLLPVAVSASKSLERSLRAIVNGLDIAGGALYLVDRNNELKRIVASANYPEPLPNEAYLLEMVAADQIELIADAHAHPKLCEHPWVCESPRWRSLAVAPLKLARAQAPFGYLLIADDQPQRFDASTQTVLEDVAHLVTERLELQLSQAEVAGEMDRMITIGILAAGVAHEINNPLSFVGGNLQFALRLLDSEFDRDDLPSAVSESLSDINEALRDALEGSRRVRNVVRDLRRLAGGNGTDDYTIEPVDVLESLKSSLSIARKHIEQRAKLVEQLTHTPMVMGNDSKLGQVFLNLLINAAQAIPRDNTGDNEVRVRTYERDGDVVISITDTGTGITEEALEHIFTPFFTTKPTNEGTGLGLAISHNIVRNLSGDIEVETALDEGTTFRVVLPSVDKVVQQMPRT
ncbi:sensor histidine kinase [Persicimonas caeni]|nr:ATP-binding protein [Persicimonas caeni]